MNKSSGTVVLDKAGSVEVRPVRELAVSGFQFFTPPQGDTHDVR
jgi:hypothetical protein